MRGRGSEAAGPGMFVSAETGDLHNILCKSTAFLNAMGRPPGCNALIDMSITCLHVHHMSKMIQLRNVPDDLHKTLKVRAAANGQSLSDYLIAQIRDIAQRPTPGEMRYRLAERTQVKVREPSVRAVRAERHRP